MSKVMDEKVVQMQFDNQQFEKNVKTSIDSIDDLKKSLKFDESVNSLKKLETESSKVTFSKMSESLDGIKVKFSALETMAITTLANITNKAVDAGLELTKSLTIDNIALGWNKYVDLSDAVGTLIHQGFNMDDVEKQLEKLMWYTDETSYNFTSMVHEIGNFTSYGQSLEDSVIAMEGIANWAALSGVNAVKAKTAMEQISQAIGQGYVALKDWQSLETLNMSNVAFQQKAVEFALKRKTLEDLGNGRYKSKVGTSKTEEFGIGGQGFRNQLSTGKWLTTDVFMDVLKYYSAANDMVRDFAEQNEISTYEAIQRLSNSLDTMDEASREVVEFGLNALAAAQETRSLEQAIDYTKEAVSSQWIKIYQSVFGNYQESVVLWSDLSERFYTLFVEDSEAKAAIFEEWKNLGGRDDFLKIWDNFFGSYDEVEGKFQGVIGVVGIIKKAFKEIFSPKLLEENGIHKVAEDLKIISERFVEWSKRFKLSEEQMTKLKESVKGLLSIFKIFKSVFTALIKPYKDLKEHGFSFINIILTITSKIGGMITAFANWLEESKILIRIVDGITESFKKVYEWIEKVFNKLTGMNFEEFGKLIKDEFEKIKTYFIDFLNGIFNSDNISDSSALYNIFDSVKNAVINFYNTIKDIFSKLPKINLTGIKEFAKKIIDVFDPVKVLFGTLEITFHSISDVIKIVFDTIKNVVSTLFDFIAKIFGKTTDALKGFNFENLIEFLVSIIQLNIFGDLSIIIKNFKWIIESFSDFSLEFIETLKWIRVVFEEWQKKIRAKTIRILAESIVLIAGSLIVLAAVPLDKLWGVVDVISVLMGELLGFTFALSKMTGFKTSIALKKTGSAILKISAALLIMAFAIKEIAKVDKNGVISGLVALTILLGEIIAFVKFVPEKKISKTAFGMLIMSAAILVLSSAIKKLGSIPVANLIAGGISLVAIMAAILGFLKLLPNKDKLISKSMGILILSVALDLLTISIKALSKLSIKELIKGIGGFSAMLLVLVVALNMLPKKSKLVSISIGLIGMSVALLLMAQSVKSLSKLSVGDLIKGLVGFSVMLAGIVVALKYMPNSAKLLATGMALIGLGIALDLVAGSIRILAKLSWPDLIKGLVAMTIILAEMVVALKFINGSAILGAAGIVLCATALTLFVPILITLGQLEWDTIGKGLLTIAATLGIFIAAAYLLSPVIGVLIGFGAAMLMFSSSVLIFAVAIGILAAGMIPLSASISLFADAIVELLIKLITAIPRLISEFVTSILNSASDIIKGLVALIDIILKVIGETLPRIITVVVKAVLEIIINVIRELANHIYEIVTEIVHFFKELFRAIVDAFSDVSFDDIKEVIVSLLKALGVLTLLLPVIVELSIITSLLPIIGANLSLFSKSIAPFLSTLSSIDLKTFESAKLLADTVLEFTAASLIDGITSWITGGSDYTKFAEQLGIIGTGLNNFSNNTKDVDVDKVKTAAEATKILADVATNLPYQSNSLAGWIAGKVTLSDFAKQMGDFAEPFNKFIEGISGTDINLDQVATVCAVTSVMTDLAKDLPFQNGPLLSWIVGSQLSLTDFAQEMEWFAPHFNEFIKKISNTNVNLQKVQVVSLATKIMTSVANNLPHQGNGLIAWIVGSKMTLTDFAQQLEWFAPHFNEFVKKTSSTNVVTSRVKGIAKAVLEMTKVANELPTAGDGIKSWFVGKTLSLTDFAQEMEWAGPHFANFISSTSSMTGSTTQAKEIATTVMEMIKVANQLPTTGDGIISWFTGKKLSLTDFAQEMEWAGPHFANFASSISGVTVDTDAMTGIVSAITEMIKVSNDLPSAQNGFLSWFLSTRELTLSQFADEMSVAAPHFKTFCETISGMTLGEGSDEKATFLMTILTGMLTACESMPKASEGLISVITGTDMKLSQFGEELAKFAPKYKDFVETFSSISHADLVKGSMAIRPLEYLGTFMTALSTLDSDNWVSVMDVLVGKQKSLSEFGAELEEFGPHYRKFLDAFEGISSESANSIATVLSSMDPLSQLLDVFNEWRQKDIWSYILGTDVPLSTFGAELEVFGQNLNSFLSNVRYSSTTKESIQPVLDLFKGLQDLIPYIPSTLDPLHQTLDTFGADVELFGNHLKTFLDIFLTNPLFTNGNGRILVNLVMDDITKLVDICIKIADCLTKFEGVDSEKVSTTTGEFATFLTDMRQHIIAFAHGEEGLDNDTITKFDEFIKNLIQIAKDAAAVNTDDVTAVLESLTGIPAESIKKMIEDVEAAPGKMTEAVNNLMDACKNAIETKGAEAKTAFNGFIASFKNKLTSTNTQLELKSVGVAIMNCIKEGISGQQSDLETTIKTLLDTIFTDTKDYVETDDVKTKLKNISKSIVDGIKTGLDDKKEDLKKKGEELANLVSDSFSETLEVNSPSKVMIRLGKFVGEGLVIGIESYDSMVRKTSSDLGTAAERGLAEAMNRIQDVIMSDPDDMLTIRPVLDLSEIQNGTKRLYSMMPNSDSFSIYGDYGMAEEIAGRVRSAEIAKNVDLDGTINKDTSDKNNPNTTFNNTFNIQGDDPRAIATEVSRIIQRQTERKEAVWGS